MPNKNSIVKIQKGIAGLKSPGVKAAKSVAVKPGLKEPDLPASDGKTITPKYLLGHQNHFDPNVYTPEGVPRTKQGSVSADTTPTTT